MSKSAKTLNRERQEETASYSAKAKLLAAAGTFHSRLSFSRKPMSYMHQQETTVTSGSISWTLSPKWMRRVLDLKRCLLLTFSANRKLRKIRSSSKLRWPKRPGCVIRSKRRDRRWMSKLTCGCASTLRQWRIIRPKSSHMSLNSCIWILAVS